MTEKPFALSLRSPYLVPFDLVVQLLPKELDEVVRSKIDVLDANRVIAFGLVPLITTKFVVDAPAKPDRKVYPAGGRLYTGGLAFPSPRNLTGAFQAWLTRSRVYTVPDPV